MNAIERITTPNLPGPAGIGQATAIEQSRAVAEVQAAVVVAQQCPRDIDKALTQMRRSCGEKAMAERAFFSFPRAGQTIEGPSIYLARDLARCWGNIQYGVAELRRDDTAGISEMQAFAWDVETNTRAAQIFIVPHKRDTKAGAKNITDLRDIYENNANQGARRVREAIFAVLPPWFTEEAQDLCRAALTEIPPEEVERRADAAAAQFGRADITLEQLEEKVGRKRGNWTAEDVASLGVLFNSLKRREITREDAFPSGRISSEAIAVSAEAANDRTCKDCGRLAPEHAVTCPVVENALRANAEADDQ